MDYHLFYYIENEGKKNIVVGNHVSKTYLSNFLIYTLA